MSVREKVINNEPTIFLDMDGPLAWFEKGIETYGVVHETVDIGGHLKREIDWDKFKGDNIEDNVYYKLEPVSEMVQLARDLKDRGYNVVILTGLPREKDPATDKNGNVKTRIDKYGNEVPVYRPCSASSHAKRAWLDKQGLGDVKMIGCFAYQKPQFMVDNSILIDDREANCKAWNKAAEEKGFNSFAIQHIDPELTRQLIYQHLNIGPERDEPPCL